MQIKYVSGYVEHLLANGRYFFTKAEALKQLQITDAQFRDQVYRLNKSKDLRSLAQNFYMIVPAEYKNFGGLPPHWIINDLMQHLNQDYYIGLLSAASLYGATHQQPMVFQVITSKAKRRIVLARGCIEFHVFKQAPMARTEKISTPAGYARISSKEQTVVDLMRFYPVCGYLSNVASVIRELADMCDATIFARVLEQERNVSVLQRLGYILMFIGKTQVSDLVQKELKIRSLQYVLLRPDFHDHTGQKDPDFKIIVNDTLELEE